MYVHSKGRMGLGVADKLDIFIATVVVPEETAKWQRVEQSIEPVVCRVVDVRVLTQVLMQCRCVGGVVVVEVGRSVQHHQHDQALLAFYRHVVVVSHVELSHTEIAATQRIQIVLVDLYARSKIPFKFKKVFALCLTCTYSVSQKSSPPP